jgi:plasmid stability protein
MARKPTDTVKLQLRLPEGLRRRLAYLATRGGRSMNNEIVHLLTRAIAFVGPSGEIPGENKAELGNLEKKGAELVLNFDGKLYRFETKDTVHILKKDKP